MPRCVDRETLLTTSPERLAARRLKPLVAVEVRLAAFGASVSKENWRVIRKIVAGF